jgi:hypothetical protein
VCMALAVGHLCMLLDQLEVIQIVDVSIWSFRQLWEQFNILNLHVCLALAVGNLCMLLGQLEVIQADRHACTAMGKGIILYVRITSKDYSLWVILENHSNWVKSIIEFRIWTAVFTAVDPNLILILIQHFSSIRIRIHRRTLKTNFLYIKSYKNEQKCTKKFIFSAFSYPLIRSRNPDSESGSTKSLNPDPQPRLF